MDNDDDGVLDVDDAFPLDASETIDSDNDGIGDNADPDDDNDGTPDSSDAFPLDPSRAELPAEPSVESQSSGGGVISLWLMISLLGLIARKRIELRS